MLNRVQLFYFHQYYMSKAFLLIHFTAFSNQNSRVFLPVKAVSTAAAIYELLTQQLYTDLFPERHPPP
jgi:hypothetical protein